jgi:hypothetical protein
VVVLMIPILLAAARVWHRVKMRFPHGATLTLVFLGTAFVYELLTRPLVTAPRRRPYNRAVSACRHP